MKTNSYIKLLILFIILSYINIVNSQNIVKLSDKLVFSGVGWYYEFEILIYSEVDVEGIASNVASSIFTRIFSINNYYQYKLTVPYAADGSFISPSVIYKSDAISLGTYYFNDINDFWEVEIISPPTLIYQSKNGITFQSTIKINNMNPLAQYNQTSIICLSTKAYSCSISNIFGGSYLIIFEITSQEFNQIKSIGVSIKAGANIVQQTFDLNYEKFIFYTASDFSTISRWSYFFSLTQTTYNSSVSNYGYFSLINDNIVGLKYPVEGVPGEANFLINSQLPLGSSYSDNTSIGILGDGQNKYKSSIVSFIEDPDDIPVEPNYADLLRVTINSSNPNYKIITANTQANITSSFIIDGITTSYHPFPFGYSSFDSNSNNITFQKEVTFVVYGNQAVPIKLDNLIITKPDISTIDTIPPIITSFTLNTVDSRMCVMRIKVTDDISGFKSFKYRGITITSENLVYGNLTNGIFEKYFDSLYDNYQPTYEDIIYIVDFAQNTRLFNSSVYFINSLSSVSYFESPSINRQLFNYENITSFEFSTNKEIDTTGKDTQLQLLFNVTYPKKDEIVFMCISKNKFKLADINYYAKNGYLYQGFWNSTLKLYQIDFTIKRNQFTTSNLDYQLYFDLVRVNSFEIQKYLPNSNSKLNVKSNYADTLGPIVKSVGTFINTVGSLTKIGWNFTIEYNLNKFKTGYSIIQNIQTLAFYNITLEKVDGEDLYQVGFFIYPNCTTSDYRLNFTLLEDEGGYKTTFDNENNLKTPLPSSFLKSSIVTLPKQCGTNNPKDDLKPPTLQELQINKTIISFNNNREIEITFSFYDDSGIDLNSSPYVYLTTTHLSSYLKVQSQIINISPDSTLVKYKAVCEIPRGFGYPYPILVNIYSVYDSFGHLTGLSSKKITDQSFSGSIETSNEGLDATYFSTISSITTNGGLLTVTGNSFKKDESPVQITIDYSTSYDEPTTTLLLESTLFVVNVKPTKYPFILKASFNGIELEKRTIYPIGWEVLPPSTPPPTNPPSNNQKCPNNCGGSSNGICSTTTFTCICYSPWVGIDCLSKVIIVTPPILNTTSPNVNITIPSTDSKENNENDHILKSLISIVELRELSVDGKMVERHQFENWIFSNQSNNNEIKYHYSNKIKSDNSFDCNINILIQFFRNETIINFANTNITMLESSLKYSVNITTYPFKSSLNSLLLVMSASIESNSDSSDICSSKDFGVANSNYQYMTVQVDKYLLYGTFINRGIIDSNIQKIDNILLNSDSLLVDNSNSKLSNSYIGIKIPYFRGIAQLDPDFSVLVSNNKATCDKDGLTGAQIAGIVVGGVVFISIIVVISILVLKSTKGKLLINNIKLKKLKE